MGCPCDIHDSVDKCQAGALIFLAGDERRGGAAVAGAGIGGCYRDGAGGELFMTGQQIDGVQALIEGRSGNDRGF